MDFPVIFANLADVIQVVIFLIIMGAGAFFQIVSTAAEKKKQQAAQKNTPPSMEEKLARAAAEVVGKPRQPKREKVVDAALVEGTSPRRKPLAPKKTAAPSAVELQTSGQTDVGIAAEIHQLLHDPRSIRQAVILSEVLTRKYF